MLREKFNNLAVSIAAQVSPDLVLTTPRRQSAGVAGLNDEAVRWRGPRGRADGRHFRLVARKLGIVACRGPMPYGRIGC